MVSVVSLHVMVYVVYLESTCIQINAIFIVKIKKERKGTKIWMQVVILLMIIKNSKDKGAPTTCRRALGRAQGFG